MTLNAKKTNNDGCGGSNRETERASPRDRKAGKKWKARLLRNAVAGPVSVEYRFPTENGGVEYLCVPLSELRHRLRLLDRFCDQMPVFPASVGPGDEHQIDFLKKLVVRCNRKVSVIPDKPGFIDKKSFATWTEVIHANGRCTPIKRNGVAPASAAGDVRGTLKGSTDNVLRLAEKSSYLAFGIGLALAAPLTTYLRLNQAEVDDHTLIVTETAVFNFSGKSSSGKSSCALAAMSLIGGPDRAGTMNFSERGLAEGAAISNDALLVADDTEKSTGDLGKALRLLTHVIPGGRSKQISKGVDQDKFPALRWTTLVLCSSPRPIPVLATESGWEMSPGDKVRLFDINVPPSGKGGIFDRISGGAAQRAQRSVKLIAKLERGYLSHYGHVFPKWIERLLSKNYAPELAKITNEFILRVDAERNGLKRRFAQKFGLVYAAMVLGVRFGLLPWPKDLPLEVALKCYRRAEKWTATEASINRGLARKLCASFDQTKRLVTAPQKGTRQSPITLSRRCVALRYSKGGRTKVGVFDDALLKRVRSKAEKTKFIAALVKDKVIERSFGHAKTVQTRVPIIRAGKLIPKPRVWEMDWRRLRKLASNS